MICFDWTQRPCQDHRSKIHELNIFPLQQRTRLFLFMPRCHPWPKTCVYLTFAESTLYTKTAKAFASNKFYPNTKLSNQNQPHPFSTKLARGPVRSRCQISNRFIPFESQETGLRAAQTHCWSLTAEGRIIVTNKTN